MAKTTGKIIFILLSTLFCNPSQADAQELDMDFLKFLMNSGRYQQVLDLVSLENNSLSESQLDSINYYCGLAHYYMKQIQPSIASLQKVDDKSSLSVPSGLFGSWNLAYSGNYEEANRWLTSLRSSDSLEVKLIGFESLGLMLLQRDYNMFSSVKETIDSSYYLWSAPLQNFDQYEADLRSFHKKSGLIAGISSAIIPGLGKIYTGNLGAGISSFLICGTLGGLTIENGLKSGWTHWSTLLFGSLFTLFYTGNIYGSIINIQHYRENFYSDMDQRILWDMHIPIRDFYR